MNQVPQRKKFDWLTAGQFGFSLLASLLLMGSSLAGILVMSLGGSLPGLAVTENQLGSALLFSAGLGFAGFLMIPSTYFSGRRLFGKPPRTSKIWQRSGWLIFSVPILIYLGYLSQANSSWGNFIFPLIHILTNGAAIFWLLNRVKRKLPGESAQRFWGVFGSGLTFAPLISLVVEILILVLLGGLWWMLLQNQPDQKQEFLNLINRLQQSSVTPAILENSISRLLESPGVVGAIFVYIAVIVPLVEELIKPIAIWFLLGRNLSPREGFLLGAVAGAGYALFENLTIAADAGIWTFVVISRLGTAAIHILTTGLVGWGLASASTEKRYARLLMSIIASVSLHGVWNGLNILSALAEISSIQFTLGSFGTYFASYAPVGLVILALGALLGLFWANSRFQRAIMSQVNQNK
jgi:RsiW-degrading membrane proteinase PrsW (M82 family)